MANLFDYLSPLGMCMEDLAIEGYSFISEVPNTPGTVELAKKAAGRNFTDLHTIKGNNDPVQIWGKPKQLSA
jgi:hypothetical protein